jgi:hypothetical protein
LADLHLQELFYRTTPNLHSPFLPIAPGKIRLIALTKSEARSTKSETKTKSKFSKQQTKSLTTSGRDSPAQKDCRSFGFVVSGFEFVSDFVFRVSDFAQAVRPAITVPRR